MIALIGRSITISPTPKFKSSLSLAAVSISAYYKYVIFVRFDDGCGLFLRQFNLSDTPYPESFESAVGTNNMERYLKADV